MILRYSCDLVKNNKDIKYKWLKKDICCNKKKIGNVHCMINVEITRSLHSFCKSYLDIYNLYIVPSLIAQRLWYLPCVSH